MSAYTPNTVPELVEYLNGHPASKDLSRMMQSVLAQHRTTDRCRTANVALLTVKDPR